MTAIQEDDSARNEPPPSATQDVAFHEDEIDLMEYVAVVVKRRRLILCVIMAFCLEFRQKSQAQTS